MAGIYLHIPLCKQACYYCDFHFSTNRNYQSEMISAMLREMELQKDYLNGEPLDTIYFGGGAGGGYAGIGGGVNGPTGIYANLTKFLPWHWFR